MIAEQSVSELKRGFHHGENCLKSIHIQLVSPECGLN
jgi:hypothetical protein